MSEFFFVLKTVLFSALLLMVLQMKVGGETLENHSEYWIYRSRVGGEMQNVAKGAVHAGYEGWSWLKSQTREVSKGIQESSDERSGVRTDQSNRRERSYRSRPHSAEDLD